MRRIYSTLITSKFRHQILVNFIVFLFLSFTLSADWYDRKAEGWFYFEDRLPPKKRLKKQKAEQGSQEVSKEESDPLIQLEKIRETLERKKAVAILEPTQENIVEYLREQNKWIDHSTEFSNNWMLAILKHPELNYAFQGTPNSRYGQKFYREQKEAYKKELITSLSEKYALLFFYEGEKPESQEVAKVIDIFSKRYGWLVTAYSVDGVECKEFPEALTNKKLKQKLGLTVFPALALVCPEDDEIIPIGYGFMSLDTIESNIELVFKDKHKNGENS